MTLRQPKEAYWPRLRVCFLEGTDLVRPHTTVMVTALSPEEENRLWGLEADSLVISSALLLLTGYGETVSPCDSISVYNMMIMVKYTLFSYTEGRCRKHLLRTWPGSLHGVMMLSLGSGGQSSQIKQSYPRNTLGAIWTYRSFILWIRMGLISSNGIKGALYQGSEFKFWAHQAGSEQGKPLPEPRLPLVCLVSLKIIAWMEWKYTFLLGIAKLYCQLGCIWSQLKETAGHSCERFS